MRVKKRRPHGRMLAKVRGQWVTIYVMKVRWTRVLVRYVVKGQSAPEYIWVPRWRVVPDVL
jgi:hypothetical protein